MIKIDLYSSKAPYYYSRDWTMAAVASSSWMRGAEKVAGLLLPFASLYQPAARPISYGINVWKCGTTLVSGDLSRDYLTVLKSVSEIAMSYFQIRSGLILNALCETLELLHSLSQAENKQEKGEKFLQCISTTVYLLSLVQPYSPYWGILSLVLHAYLNFYQAYQSGIQQEEQGRYKYANILSKTVMGLIRSYQAYGIYNHNLEKISQLEKTLKQKDIIEKTKEGNNKNLEKILKALEKEVTDNTEVLGKTKKAIGQLGDTIKKLETSLATVEGEFIANTKALEKTKKAIRQAELAQALEVCF